MKDLKEYAEIFDNIEEITLEEESTASSTATAGVDNPDAKPMFKKTKFMGHKCIEVDEDTYTKCIQGKRPFSRWGHYVEDEALRDEMKKMFQSNKRLLMMNAKNGSMAFVK